MILYHVSDRIDREVEKKFIPKVPDSVAGHDENTTIPRICFAPSVVKCIEAIGLNTDMQEYITVYQLDTSTIDEDSYLVGPDKLTHDGLVYDASENKEYWVLCPVTLKPMYYKILDAEWELPDATMHKKLVSFNMEAVAYESINNPFSGAIAAMFGQ